MKSNGIAETRRAYEELTTAYQRLEEENRRLRLENEQLKRSKGAPAPVVRVRPLVTVKAEPSPGKLVEYVDKHGRAHTSLVLEREVNGKLRIKVFVHAGPDVVIEALQQGEERKTECWRWR